MSYWAPFILAGAFVFIIAITPNPTKFNNEEEQEKNPWD